MYSPSTEYTSDAVADAEEELELAKNQVHSLLRAPGSEGSSVVQVQSLLGTLRMGSTRRSEQERPGVDLQ